MSANADLITMETYYNKMKQFENQFFIYGAKYTTNYILGYSSIILLIVLLISYPLTHIYVHCKIWKQYDKTVLSLKPKYEETKLFFIFVGAGVPLRQTQVNENIRAVRPHHRADLCITRGKNTISFSYISHNIKLIALFGYPGAPRWPIQKSDGPILLPQLSSHLYQYTYKIWKQSVQEV